MAPDRAIKPWMVAAFLAMVGVVGATLVFFAAQSQHRTDRRDITTWEREYLPVADDAARTQTSMPSLKNTSDAREARTRLERDRARLLAKALPDIVRPVTAQFVDAIDAALSALSKLDASGATARTDAFNEAWSLANALFADARATLNELLCRAELEGCSPA